jgi:FR47-like protein
MRPLQLADVKGIHDLYPASEIESISVFEKLVETLPGFGIFTIDGELAAWMVQSYYGAMFSMQTKPEHRRKG